MGALDCKANPRSEEKRVEADITSAFFNTPAPESKSLYQTLTPRVVAAKEELLANGYRQLGTGTHEKNYDQYYAFLSTQILNSAALSHCSTSNNSEDNFSRNSKPPPNPRLATLSPTQMTKKPAQGRKQCSRPKTRTKPRPVPGKGLRITIESPTLQLSLKHTFPGTISSCLTSKRPSQGQLTVREKDRKHSSGKLVAVAEPPKTLLQIESKKRFGTCTAKKEGTVQFDIISLLPENVQSVLFSYIIDQYPQCLCVSAAWYTAMFSSFDQLFNKVESALALRGIDAFLFRNSYMQCLRYRSTKGECRLDRVLQLELLPGCEGKTLTLGYTYSFANEKRTLYMTQYKIDCKPRGKRVLWINKSRDRRTGHVSAHSVNIVPVCVGDIFEIAINYYTARGLIDVSSVEWLEPIMEKTPEYSITESSNRGRNSLSPEQLREAKENLNRVCEYEQMSPEWYDSRYYAIKGGVPEVKTLEPFFEVNSVEYSVVDTKIRKICLTAGRCGVVPKQLTGIKIVVRPETEPCVSEAKRIGLMIDRGCDLQLRSGDVLILYQA